MRLALYGAVSTLLTGAVLYSTFLTPTHTFPPFRRQNFYTSAIALSNSSASLLILLNFGIFGTLVWGKALQALFFGTLRAIEVEHLYERSWFAVTETCLAMTIFRDEFDAPFVTLFVALLFTKIFHWLYQDRVDFMEQSLQVPVLFHIRMVTLMVSLLIVDSIFVAYSVKYTMATGANMLIVFGFEYAILVATLLATFSKYVIHVLDSRTEEAWENKSMYIFYLELVTDFMKLAIYLIFFVIVLSYYGVPLHIIRDIYVTLRSFLQKCRDLVRYRQATRNMNERYPDATIEELARMSDPTCIICREEMVHHDDVVARQRQPQTPPPTPAAPREGRNPMAADIPKKLPCGHIFHFSCLRSWLERQQSCPTCRSPVLNQEGNNPTPAPPAPAPAPVPEAGNQAPGTPPAPPNPPPYSTSDPAPPSTGPGSSTSNQAQPPSTSSGTSTSAPTTRTTPSATMPAIIPLGDIEASTSARGGSRFRLGLFPSLTDEETQQLASGTREAMLQQLDLIQRSQAHLVAVATVLSQALSIPDPGAPSARTTEVTPDPTPDPPQPTSSSPPSAPTSVLPDLTTLPEVPSGHHTEPSPPAPSRYDPTGYSISTGSTSSDESDFVVTHPPSITVSPPVVTSSHPDSSSPLPVKGTDDEVVEVETTPLHPRVDNEETGESDTTPLHPQVDDETMEEHETTPLHP